KSRIFVLDEATASVDLATEFKIRQAVLNNLTSTVIMIAHRLETLEDCDEIVVLDNGRVLEVGRPQDLLNNPNSAFAKLHQSLANQNNNQH
ncbi:MAG: hypothetical protein EZS28_039607, partial [Streblomastix strix]